MGSRQLVGKDVSDNLNICPTAESRRINGCVMSLPSSVIVDPTVLGQRPTY